MGPRSKLGVLVGTRGGGRGCLIAEVIWRRWGGDRPAMLARAFVLAACACLFLNAAATIEFVYTLRLSYLLLAAGCLVGLPFVVRGWRSLPATLRWPAGVLVATYLLAAVAGSGETLVAQERAGARREVVYLVDLLLGLGVVGLLAGLFRERRRICLALAAVLLGGLVAAAYGIVQWPARHYGWPLANINNALNPDAVSRGEVVQGNGLLLGWERVRGTFTEPLFFGLYLGAILPLVAVWLRWERRRLLVCAAAASIIALALLLTSSFPSWAIFVVATLIGLSVFSVSRGAVLPAALAGGALSLVAVGVALVLFGNPQIFANVTGRGASELTTTASTRTGAWERSVRVWSRRPVLGHGPGQSAVQLAYRQGARRAGSRSRLVPLSSLRRPLVLGSAQGLLPAALIDAGLVGALACLGFIVACLALVMGGLARSPSGLRLGVTVAGLVAVGGGLFSGDRFEMQTWVVLGLALVVATSDLGGTGETVTSS